ncbi:MAG: ABC transporter substrate-binding protein [Firmicutes bacterium]|nr:ABC transporter substrate-binding protein [Bacillota bacterium]
MKPSASVKIGAIAGVAGLLGFSLLTVSPAAAASRPAQSTSSDTFVTYAPTGYLPVADWNIFGGASSTVGAAVGVLAFSPLAIQSNTLKDGGQYFYGQLAQSWNYADGYKEFVVHLRPNLKWNNGTPLTAKDVVTTWDLYGLTGVWVADQITNVYAPNSTTVVFVRKNNTYAQAFEGQVLTPIIAPASVYQKFLPPASVFKQMMYADALPTSKQGPYKKILNELTADAKKLVAFNPGNAGLITAGPYEVESFSPGEVLLKKNPYNWAAKNVHVPYVELINQTSTEATQNEAVGGDFDAFGYQPTTPLYDAIMDRNAPYMHYVKPAPFLTVNGLFFNFADYPFNLLAVRQAFAYLLNRNAIMKLADPVAGVPAPIPMGAPPDYMDNYLTPAQIKTLNPYHRNPAKAAKLLESVGFKKKNGIWYTPKGKPFDVTIISATTLASWDLTASATANELTQFGIPAKVELRDVASYGQETLDGEYPVFAGYVQMWPFQPWGSLGSIFAYWGDGGIGYTPSGTLVPAPKGQPGYDLPLTFNVPGIGKVDPSKLAWEFESAPTKAEQDAIMYKLLKTMNYECWPLVEYYQDQSFFYSTKNFVDWPTNRSFFDLIGDGSANYFLTVAEEQGYVRPR